MTAARLAKVYELDAHRPTAPIAVPQPRATLAVCWRRSQLRRDLIERGTGLLVGVVLLAVLLLIASAAGWVPA